jgi:hypothetical protein
MPYVMDTGPYLSVLEGRLNDPSRRVPLLTALRTDEALATIAGLDSTNLAADNKTPDQRVEVLNTLWFGMKPPRRGTSDPWTKQQSAVPTGFWRGFQGDPEAILREALIRAVEVSLGIDYDADPAKKTREWPIEISWICQGPFFQCWVTWLEAAKGGSGHVSLTITTPAAEGLPLNAKITRATVKPEYASPPPADAWKAARGMWVLGHEDYTRTPYFSTVGSYVGVIFEPRVDYRRKSTAVVCVAPAEWEGGVLAAGRPYTAPAKP